MLFLLRLSLTLGLLVSSLSAFAREPVKDLLPATPDGTVKAFHIALGEGKLEVIWQALPASYQADVKKLVVTFSKKMDAELWEQGQKVADKLAKLCNDKSDFIIGNQFIEKMAQAQAWKIEDLRLYIKANAEQIAKFHTSTATLPDVEKLDIEEFLISISPTTKQIFEIGARLGFVAPSVNLSNIVKTDVKLLSTANNTASIEVIEPDGTKQTLTMVRIENKWIPKFLADDWSTGIAKMQTELDGLQFKPEVKQRVMMLLAMTNGMLDTLSNAKTQAEFDAAVKAALPLVQQVFAKQPPAQPKSEE